MTFNSFRIRVLLAGAAMGAAPALFGGDTYNFNPGWLLSVGDQPGAETVKYDDSGWKPVTLPRAFNEDEAFRIPIAAMTDTVAWYRKHFRLPADARGKKIFLEFEGARQGADVYVNSHHMGTHENGVMAFGFDITPYVVPGKENTVAVRTDNDWRYKERATGTNYQWNDKNFNANYGGLPKNVILHVMEPVYQTLPLLSSLGTVGTYVYARNIDLDRRSADINVESEVRNETERPVRVTMDVELTDPDGKKVASFVSKSYYIPAGQTAMVCADSRVDGLNFWSWGYGYLYDVRTTLRVDGKEGDAAVTRTGFRKTEFGNGMFRLNGRAMMVHGYAQRSSNEWPGVGMSVPPWLSDLSNAEEVRSGGNVVRWMHITPWKQDVESCDRVGLLQAMPAGDSERDSEGRKWEQRVELMADAIVYNRNNPSIIFYESGNKGVSESHMADMLAVRDRYDPFGGRAIGSREMLDSRLSEYGGEMLYINKSGGQPLWAMEYSRDEGLRRYWDDYSYPFHKSGDGPLYRNADASDYNRNQDQLAVEHIRRWHDYWLQRPGTGDRVSGGGVKIIFSDTHTHCRGESNYRASGVTDAMRLPKDSYYAHRVMWDGWVTPERSHTYIMGHWNYPEGTVKPVYVVSDAPRVELTLNGRPVGSERIESHFLHTFDSIAWEPGELVAVSRDAAGKELSRHTLVTAGAPAALRMKLMTSPAGMLADGADLALVEFEVVDAQGRRCPLDNTPVTFTLSGPAEWRGGIAKGEGNCAGALTLPVECGVNRALVRSLPEAGKITLTASAEGLPSETLTWESVPVESAGGLASVFPKDYLKGSLERGATPASPSYTDIKESVRIVGAEAGSNSADARLSFDDNEKSEWRNDGTLRNGWIRYDFNGPQTVDEVSLKLTGWRRRSYPIEILADNGEVIYSGSTPTSLGYVNLPLAHADGTPVVTSSVTLRLAGSSTDSEGFGQITELVQPVANDLDLFKAADGDKVNSELRVIEADFLRRR